MEPPAPVMRMRLAAMRVRAASGMRAAGGVLRKSVQSKFSSRIAGGGPGRRIVSSLRNEGYAIELEVAGPAVFYNEWDGVGVWCG